MVEIRRMRREPHEQAGIVGSLLSCAVLMCCLSLGSPLKAQWTGGASGTLYYNSGNVGIGIANPQATLDVNGQLATRGAVHAVGYGVDTWIPYGDGNTYFRIPSRGYAHFDSLPGYGTIMAINNNGNVGIGTTNPGAPLTFGDSLGNRIQLYTGNGTTNRWGMAIQNWTFVQYMDGGSPSAGKFSWRTSPADGDASTGPEVANLYTAGNLDLVNGTNGILRAYGAGNNYFAGNVGIGTTAPQHLLHVAGTIGAQEVMVSSTGADYVFQPDYRLEPLDEVAAYIRENHHLPNVPSESEVKENGVGISVMQSKLLAKIEELTLHLIHEHERNDRLELETKKLQEELARIEGEVP